MKKICQIIIFLFLTISTFAQVDVFTEYPLESPTGPYARNNWGSILKGENGQLIFISKEFRDLYISRSDDAGLTWYDKQIFHTGLGIFDQFTTATNDSGIIIIIYKNGYIVKSQDYGKTWTDSLRIEDESVIAPILSKISNEKLFLTYLDGSNNIKLTESNDFGSSWSEAHTIHETLEDIYSVGDIVQLEDSILFTVYPVSVEESKYKYSSYLEGAFSYDNGIAWTNQFQITNNETCAVQPRLLVTGNNEIELYYTEMLKDDYVSYYPEYSEFSQLGYKSSYDGGQTWSEKQLLTKYTGRNCNLTLNKIDDYIHMAFKSDRFEEKSLWYGTNLSDDIYTPPKIRSTDRNPVRVTDNTKVTFTAEILDDEKIPYVKFVYQINRMGQSPLQMNDDGVEGDTIANDNIFTVIHEGFNKNDSLSYSYNAIDAQGYEINSELFSTQVIPAYSQPAYRIEINRFKLPIDNKGVLGDVRGESSNNDMNHWLPSGRLDDVPILFSAGFWLTGYADGELWGNSQFPSARHNCYQPGQTQSDPDDSLNLIYIVNNGDEPFGASWQNWRTAVSLGAKFYDGNGDGVYDPIDLNENGLWDENEDMPDILGDVTTWTVYNDGIPPDNRVPAGEVPKEIEIKQTLFAYSPETYPELDGVIFIRYILENKNQINEVLDSVYFSCIADPDIGESYDDMVGTDTLLRSSFAYNHEEDEIAGINPPALFTTLLQGPPIYVVDETYTDINVNQIYDEGIDIPLDTAKYLGGEYLGFEEFRGARNLYLSSSTGYWRGYYGDPDYSNEIRYYQLARNHNGEPYDPCEEYFSVVIGEEDCNEIDPKYTFSGDPVTQKGWLNNDHFDVRYSANTGPFELREGVPVEIIVAYSAGRGSDQLNSITETRKLVKSAIGFYNSNFTSVPVSVKEYSRNNSTPSNYQISQNYPNPFNPITTITYSIPEQSNVELKVYDVLGREVAELVNKEQPSGSYKVNFDASQLSSGIYFYKIQAGSFIESKKMTLIK